MDIYFPKGLDSLDLDPNLKDCCLVKLNLLSDKPIYLLQPRIYEGNNRKIKILVDPIYFMKDKDSLDLLHERSTTAIASVISSGQVPISYDGSAYDCFELIKNRFSEACQRGFTQPSNTHLFKHFVTVTCFGDEMIINTLFGFIINPISKQGYGCGLYLDNYDDDDINLTQSIDSEILLVLNKFKDKLSQYCSF